MYLSLKKGMVVGFIAGLIGAVIVLGMCVWASTWPTVTEVSLRWAFRPWWRGSNWLEVIGAFILFGLSFGVLAALRPEVGVILLRQGFGGRVRET